VGVNFQIIFSAFNGGIRLFLNSSNQIFVGYIDSTNNILNITSSFSISVNTWYYFTIMFQSSRTCSVYVNNTLIGTVTSGVGVLPSSGVFSLGTYDNATDLAFNGYVDDLKITNSVSTYVPIPLLQPNIWLPFENNTADLGSNAITPTVTGSLSYVPGVVGLNAVNLVNTLGPTTSAPATQYIRGSWNGSSKWTVSFWFNMQSYSTSQSQSTLFSSYEDTLLIMIYNNSLGLYTNSGTQIATSTQPAMNTWHYVTYIHQNNGLCSLYFNNSLVGTYNNPSALGTATRFSLGTYNAVALYPFNGYIDDFRIYSTDIPYHTLFPQNYRSLALSGTGQYALASAASGWVVGSSDSSQTWSKQAVCVGTQSNFIQPQLANLAAASWIANGVSWTATASSTLTGGYDAYRAFNNDYTTRWVQNSYTYSTAGNSSGQTTTIQGTIGTVTGDWLQIQSSIPLVMSSYQFANGFVPTTMSRLPRTFHIVGSNDGTTWFPIQSGTGATSPSTSNYTLINNTIIVNNNADSKKNICA
jgi:hypothetical protein